MNGNTIMMGLVDNVYKSKTQSSQGVGRTIAIRGRDMTKMLIEDSIANAPELMIQQSVVEFLGVANTQFLSWVRGLMDDGQYIFAGRSIIQAVWYILKNTPSMNVIIDGYQGGNNVKASDLFMASLTAKKTDKIFQETMSQYAGQLINYIMQVVDEPFYEVWVDTMSAQYQDPNSQNREDRPALIVRPKPFDRASEIDTKGNAVVTENDCDTIDPSGSGIQQTQQPSPTQAVAPTQDLSNPQPIEFANAPDPSYWLNHVAPLVDATSTIWDNLTCAIRGKAELIYEREITKKNLGISDYEAFSIYKLIASNDPIATAEFGAYGYYFPIVEGKMIQEYGAREFRRQSNTLPQLPSMYWSNMINAAILNNQTYWENSIDAYEIPFRNPSNQPLDTWLKKKNNGFGLKENLVNSLQTSPASIGQLLTPQQDWLAEAIAKDTSARNVTGAYITRKRDILWRWNRYNHLLESGTIECSGRDVRVGSKVALPDEETRGIPGSSAIRKYMEYYCVSVDQAWRFGENWITNIGLSRGHNPVELQEYAKFRNFDKVAGPDNKVFTSTLDEGRP